VTWNYEMGSSNSSNSANCWLKNGTTEAGFQVCAFPRMDWWLGFGGVKGANV
jgi:hypothetical protein